MNETDDTQTPASARAAELIVDFMTRHDGLPKQAADIARHREDLRATAEREAADLVAKAHAEIRRTLADTRRDLLALAAQLRAVDRPLKTGTPATTPPADWQTDPDFVSKIRCDLEKVLSEGQPDLEELSALTRFFGTIAEPQSELPVSDRTKDRFPSIGPDAAVALEAVSPDRNSEEAPWSAATFTEKIKDLSHGTRAVIVVATLGAIILPLAGWRLAVSGGRSAPATVPETNSRPATTVPTSPVPPTDRTASQREQSSVPVSAAAVRQTWLWLLVEARRGAWIQVTTDGKTEQGRTLQAGERRRILANHSISILMGDAGAVTLAFNGGEAMTPGRDGQVLTRLFTTEDAEKIIASHARDAMPGTTATARTEPARGRQGMRGDNTRSEILMLSQQWFDGYYRGDSRTMAYLAAANVSIGDRRSFQDRLPAGVTKVSRSFDQVQFEQQGDLAVLSARMTEDGDFEGYPAHTVSLVSERWRRQGDRWRLAEVAMRAGMQ